MEKRKKLTSYGYSESEIKFYLSKNGHAVPTLPIKVLPQGFSDIQLYDPIEFERVMGIHYVSHLHFKDETSFENGLRNCPWLLLHTPLGEISRDLGKLYQQEILTGYLPDLSIQWKNDKMGYGVFNNEDLLAGEFIGEYTGEVRQQFRLHPDHNAYCFHYPSRFWNWNYYMIDAAKMGNVLRYMNHSDDPNLQPAWALDRHLLHMVFFALDDIPKGTELTFDYGPDYWRLRSKL